MGEDGSLRQLLKGIASVEQAVSMGSFNPLKAGGVADYFTIARTSVELAAAVKAAMDAQLPYVVISRATGVLFSDGGFPGLVIQNLADSLAIAADRSQVVADSGVSLSRFITVAASHGLGGLSYLYGETGSIGGAVYRNLSDGMYVTLSSLRYLTMLMPPQRLDREATIVRYKSDWLAPENGQTKLQRLKATQALAVHQPVILTVLLQVTSIRPDELQQRLEVQVKRRPVVKDGFGPLFAALPETDIEHLLIGAGVAGMREGRVYPDRYHPNYLRASGSGVSSIEVRTLIQRIQDQVQSVYGTALVPRIEFVGQW